MKRAAELRDILGLAKCCTLLSNVIAQQKSIESTQRAPTETSKPRIACTAKSPTLRADAAEWTPTGGTENHISKSVFHLSLNCETATQEVKGKPLLPTFTPTTATAPPGAYYIPSTKAETSDDGLGDGNQFISSLAERRSHNPPPGLSGKSALPPHGLKVLPLRQAHTFPLNASLLPHTFSVHLLSSFHSKLQQVAAALEMLDGSFANEIAIYGPMQAQISARWETWMSPAGAADMSKALAELRKALDEMCGATARAGWIVDSWSSYQEGKSNKTTKIELELGSAAINGVELGIESDLKKKVQAPIGRPGGDKKKQPSAATGGMGYGLVYATGSPNGVGGSGTGSKLFRPPPGLGFPSTSFAMQSALKETPLASGVELRKE